MKDKIKKLIQDSIDTKQKLLAPAHIEVLEKIASRIIEAYKAGKKVAAFGNGGSAADAQHFAAELVSRFQKERPALPAIAFTTDTSILTAIGNDYSFENVFTRQVEAFVQAQDVVIGISTSGKSPNVLKALELARKRGAVTVGFTGQYVDALKEKTDLCLGVPSGMTARVQECHILAIHIICALVEEKLFGEK